MSTASPNLHADEVGRIMSNLFGIDVHAVPAPWDTSNVHAAVATYVDDSDFIRGQILCDLRCVAIFGAALTQIPMGAVEDCLDSGELSMNLKANAHEVFNIAVNLFSRQQSSRVVLKDVRFGAGTKAPKWHFESHAEDFQLSIKRYGEGYLRMVYQA